MPKQENTEQLILQAATKVFKEKGYDGTRVQDIANEAKTTKSMVNYYFRSKEKLFGAVFATQFREFVEGVAEFMTSEMSIYDKIVRLVELDLQKLTEFPELPLFVINEINRNPELVFKTIGDLPINALTTLNKQIASEVRKGKIKKVRAEDLFINIRALTVFPFLSKALQMKAFNISEKEFQNRIVERKKMIVEIIWNWIKVDDKNANP